MTTVLGLAAAQRPAWIPRDAPAVATRMDHELGWFDPVIGRLMVLGADFNAASAGPVMELDGRSCIHRLSVTPVVAPSATGFGIGRHKIAYARDRRVAVLVVADPIPVTWEWDGVDWRTVTTPTSLPASGCISSLSWNDRPGAAEVLATTGGQIWGYDGTDWRYRGALPFDPQFGVYVPTLSLHVFGVRAGPWVGSMVAWDGLAVRPIQPTLAGPIPPDGFGAGKRVAFDAGAGRLVMTGFSSLTAGITSYEGLLWEQGGNVFLGVAQLANAPPSHGFGSPSIVYDDVRARVVLFGVPMVPPAHTVWELPSGGTTWSERSRVDALPTPTGLTGVDLAYDRQLQRSVMFGGSSSSSEFTAETWSFDGAHWLSHGVDPNVLGRTSAALAYVGSIGRTLMFGGNTESAGAVDELWSWNGSQWSTIGNGQPRPAPRFGHDMVWHEARNRVVLFGGFDGQFLRNDTWEYDPLAQAWQQIGMAAPPSPRNFAKLVYDSQRQRVILFGGANATGALDDTWEYSTPAGGWSQLAPPARPQGRWAHAMEYDAVRNRVVLLGGWGYVPCGGTACPGLLDDHWEFDSTTWRQRPSGPPSAPGMLSTPLPPRRAGAGMTFDARRNRLVLFGGTDGTNPRGDTFDFESGTDTFATGQASGGVALRSLRPAVAGTDLALEFENPSSFGWLAVHLATVPSPTHFVDPPIACGSRAWFYGLQPIVANVGGNPGVLQFRLPAWLLGVGLEFQAIALDAPGSCLRVSDPLSMVVQAP